MLHNIKKALRSNITLKVTAAIIGYTLWATMSQSQSKQMWLTVPVSVHSLPDTITMNAPETIKVQIAGRKSDLCTIDTQNLALHIDGQTLHAGKNFVAITNTTLFLPDTIKLLHYTPHHVIINIEQSVQKLDQPTIIT